MSRDPQINIRLPQDLKDDVQNMASDNKRSVNAEIVAVLLDAVRKHESVKNGQTIDNETLNPEKSQNIISMLEINEELKNEQIRLMTTQRELLSLNEKLIRQLAELIRISPKKAP
ncbi:Rha family transcriptional regulator [Xenorhabdus mauleonii]|uniref:Arc-like DNA binding domain-containing protein n=1 Tax=Xenorhabdus mauleonii TaxID=351675 RepID=A0A1I3WR88_9GAMM|nr:Arc family DNA-binding protein [Xenorhabdus mauleonii]PHM39263.1 Rha family transcriptional regulator [Xenorhabdus mauleonii]SFK09367.1 Arc-like DNA binding domain-containing protein [Xenorhabdus mauleonii]